MAGVKAVNLGAAFFVELLALAAFAYWGWYAGGSTLVSVLLAIAAPVVVAVIWGIFLAPASRRRLGSPTLLAAKVVLFGLATIALVVAGRAGFAIAFAIVAAVNLALLRVLGER